MIDKLLKVKKTLGLVQCILEYIVEVKKACINLSLNQPYPPSQYKFVLNYNMHGWLEMLMTQKLAPSAVF